LVGVEKFEKGQFTQNSIKGARKKKTPPPPPPTKRISMKFWEFFRKSVAKIKILLKAWKNNGYFQKYVCKFTISR